MKAKIIIDTNVWVSYLLSGKYIELDKLILSDKFQIIFSSKLLEELILVINRPKLSKYINQKDINNILNFIETNTEFVITNDNVNLCRDEKDNFLLSMCEISNANYLITGDKDLLIIEIFNNTQIMTYNEFISKFF
jgi:putative PIN family toxin of toxin-antitoxin system